MKIGAVIVGVLLSSAASACECASFLNDDVVTRASSVFIFKLLDARLLDPKADQQRIHDDRPAANRAEARIEVIDSLKGDGDKFQTMQYSVFYCCGLRLGLGEYYVGFADDPGPEFLATNANILSIGPFYDPGSGKGVRSEILALITHGKPIDRQIYESSWSRVDVVGRPLPPPCTAPEQAAPQ
jgi:hypothetical protein